MRECSGAWHYGAYYRCNRVTKLTFLKLVRDALAETSCEFVFLEKK